MQGLRATRVALARTRRWRGLTLLTATLWAGLGTACTGPLVRSGDPDAGTFTHRKLGYRIAAPRVDGPAWRRFDLEGADLAYRDRQGSVMSLATRCRTTRASAAALARHVTIGTERTALLTAGPFELAGASGWTQTFDTEEDGIALRVKAVTLLVPRCVYDWLLVVRRARDFDPAEVVFDEWVESFEPPPDGASSQLDDPDGPGEGSAP